MGRLGFVITTMGLMLAGTAAYAQSEPAITGVSSSAESFVVPSGCSFECTTLSGGQTSLGYGGGAKSFPNATYPSRASGNAQWNSFVNNNPDAQTITFESSNTVGGQPIGVSSTSTVVVGLNDGGSVNLSSTITPAAMGFYVANAGDGSCILTGTCRQVAAGSAYDFAAFAAAPGDLLAQVGFSFSITASAAGFSDNLLYSVTSGLQLTEDGSLIINQNLSDGFAKLTDFGLQTPPAGGPGNIPYHSLGYNWSETGVPLMGGLFETGFQTITYRTTVFSYASAPCLSGGTGVDDGVTACLVAYSGFGDPIGRGVSADSVSSLSGGVGIFNHGEDDQIGGVHFSPFTMTYPRLNGNTLEIGGGTVPEPATWAMMIMGFGGIGAVLRRRRVLGATI
jgi:hypothetical protein